MTRTSYQLLLLPWRSAARTFLQPSLGARRTSSSSSSSPTSPPQTFYHLFPKTLPSGPPPAGPFTLTPTHLRSLRQEFFTHQLTAHPDRTQDPTLKKRFEAASAHLNKAYQTLVDPLSRAQHLLSVRGIDVADDETLRVDDEDFLDAVMRAREDVEDVSSEGEWRRANDDNEARIRAAMDGLEGAFGMDDLAAAKRLAVELLYWRNAKRSLEAWRDRADEKSWGRPPTATATTARPEGVEG